MEPPVCPHCDALLTSEPKRKTKCKHCGELIFVRTRPADGEKTLTTESGAQEIDLQWEQYHAKRILLSRYADSIVEEAELLTEALGALPRDLDVAWSVMFKERQRYLSNRQWGLYRNVTFDMAELLTLDHRYDTASSYFVDVCTLDLWLHEKLNAESGSRSDPDDALASGVVSRLRACMDAASLSVVGLSELIVLRRTQLPMLGRWSRDGNFVAEKVRKALQMGAPKSGVP